jgi:nucleoside-diphosphate-sugar epimerase
VGKRVAVIGASGLVGASLVEDAIDDREVEVIPIIHSSGNAWRLIRSGLEVRFADLLDKGTVEAALQGCTHVVNCSRGDNKVMLEGLGNLISVARDIGVKGFIHLSSVMVYGDPPGPDSTNESGGTPRQPITSYGGIKLRQDLMVKRAASSGMPSLILCPPNISGPYSYFLNTIVGNLRAGSFALLEEGGAVCNLVDVHSLSQAIVRGLDCCTKEAPRLFVTDDEDTSWKQVTEALLPLCADAPEPMSIERVDLVKLRAAFYAKPRLSVLRSMKHLVSSDVRAALRKDPLLARIDGALRGTVASLGTALEEKMRLAVEGPIHIARAKSTRTVNVSLSIQQLRGVRHSCAQAKRMIGYGPRYSFAESMEAYRAWYRSHGGLNSPTWALARHLS